MPRHTEYEAKMALTREQYDSLMRDYSRRRDMHRREQQARKREIYAALPAYRELDRTIPELSLQELTGYLNGSEEACGAPLSDRLKDIERRKRDLLTAGGYPADYLELKYDCPACRDTGYADGAKCRCLRKEEQRILYRQSRLERLLIHAGFDRLSSDYYKGEDRARFESALSACRHFIDAFDEEYGNLFFYGTVGTGKSSLCISTAGELLASGHSVLYFSAGNLFETISSYLYQPALRSQYTAFLQDLYGCDLLVIDDLGTEASGSFSATHLFSLLTEREIARRSTMISTNLSLQELRDRYSDRIFSRVMSTFTVRKLTGPDIRIEKKVHPAGTSAGQGPA